jgi:riboflavin biosynthesis pyrimidine reductase
MTSSSMRDDLICLYPDPGDTVPLEGLYLHSGLRESAGAGPLVYTNFIASIDGRIALARADGHLQAPKAITNPRDWRLFQELAALSDVLITSASQMRDIAHGQKQDKIRDKAQDGLPLSHEPAYQDLVAFRRERGLSPQPAVAIVSASLDIPLSSLPSPAQREAVIITGAQSDLQRQRALSKAGYRLITVGDSERVDGAQLVAALVALNYKIMYSIGGPQLCHTLLASNQLHSLYVTSAHRLLGGTDFDTLMWGPAFATPRDLELRSLYLDPAALDGAGQCFAHYAVQG